MTEARLASIGGGNMAQAILRGAIDTGVIQPGEILVAEPDATKRALFERWGAVAVEGAAALADRLPESAQIMLAVKPQFLADAARDLGAAADDRVVISILAGSTSVRIRESLGGSAKVIRVMPNLPARIRKGITAMAIGAGASAGDDAFAVQLFEGVGDVIRIDEALMDAFTAIAGSGPAYVFYLAEAMRDAGVRMGFDEATALRIVRATIDGAATLMAQSTDDPTDLRNAVTSRKGTTDAAITSMENAHVRSLIEQAVLAARDRGAELAKL